MVLGYLKYNILKYIYNDILLLLLSKNHILFFKIQYMNTSDYIVHFSSYLTKEKKICMKKTLILRKLRFP